MRVSELSTVRRRSTATLAVASLGAGAYLGAVVAALLVVVEASRLTADASTTAVLDQVTVPRLLLTWALGAVAFAVVVGYAALRGTRPWLWRRSLTDAPVAVRSTFEAMAIRASIAAPEVLTMQDPVVNACVLGPRRVVVTSAVSELTPAQMRALCAHEIALLSIPSLRRVAAARRALLWMVWCAKAVWAIAIVIALFSLQFGHRGVAAIVVAGLALVTMVSFPVGVLMAADDRRADGRFDGGMWLERALVSDHLETLIGQFRSQRSLLDRAHLAIDAAGGDLALQRRLSALAEIEVLRNRLRRHRPLERFATLLLLLSVLAFLAVTFSPSGSDQAWYPAVVGAFALVLLGLLMWRSWLRVRERPAVEATMAALERRTRRCAHCDGSGTVVWFTAGKASMNSHVSPCPRCHGSGHPPHTSRRRSRPAAGAT